MDTARFAKLMMLTTSPYDGEALNALRKANEVLKTHKITWADLLEGKFKHTRTDQEEPPKKSQPEKPKYPASDGGKPWTQNDKGNWCRYWDGFGVVTVFKRKDGTGWQWVCKSTFSQQTFSGYASAIHDWESSHH